MASFKDNKDRVWEIDINVYALKRLKSLLQFDLIESASSAFEQLYSDPVLLCDVLYVLCKEQADKQKVKDEDFGRSMRGDAVYQATNALVEATADFFPKERKELILQMLQIREKAQAEANGQAEKKLNEMKEMSLDELVAMSRESSGNAPASSGSTQARLRSAS